MRLVVLESPYAGDVERNIRYARMALADCIRRGEAPLASHLLYTQAGVLNDDIPAERQLGINAGHAWIWKAEAVVVYQDRGITRGMLAGVERARRHGIPVEYRTLEQWHD